jgi:hypothetical protein
MATAWPGTLPDSFTKDSFSDTPTSGVIRTEMDSGAPKVRNRFTAVQDIWSGSMIMTTTQITQFKTYFNTTINYGSDRVDFPDQYNLASTREARFLIPSGGQPYQIRQDGETNDWLVSFTMEVF